MLRIDRVTPPTSAATRPRRRPLVSSAVSHAAQPGRLVAAAVLALVAGCGSGSAQAPQALGAEELARQLDQLAKSYEPVDPVLTSDKQDAWFLAQRALSERLRAGPRELGAAALARYGSKQDELPDVRAALLDVAAHCDAAGTAPTLEHLIRTYDGELGLGLRTRAVEFLARTSPERAIARFEPMLRESEPHATRPSQEAFVRGWAIAAHALKLEEAHVLCDVVVDLKQPSDARYAAVQELARFGGKRAEKALREVLVEAASDGLIRRKAAQALVDVMPREELCAVLEQVSEHEHDDNFLYFVASMIERYCAH
jgi:HEAT repeat protein